MSKSFANVGQHLCVGITGLALTPETRRLLETVRPGGIILFSRNIDNSQQLRDLTRELHEILPAAFIAIDQEGKRVNRLRTITGDLPAIADIKRANSARDFGQQVGQSLREHGIDLDFAPVLDLDVFDNPTDNALRDRCWGKTADEVTRWAGEFIDGLTAAGILACGKHFPGLGGAQQDSHDVLPTVTHWSEDHVRPFAALRDRLPAIMVSHAHYPVLDNRPASLSRAISSGLLRDKLGFTGVVVTDDMEMGAITNFERAVVDAVQAGADLVLVCHTPEKIMAAYEALAKIKISAESTQRLHELVRKT